MNNMIRGILVGLLFLLAACGDGTGGKGLLTEERDSAAETEGRLLRATYSPLHFKPAIDAATDEQCLACHKEVLEDKLRVASPAAGSGGGQPGLVSAHQYLQRGSGHLPSPAHGDPARPATDEPQMQHLPPGP
jgi:hypothetical protein